MSDESNETDKSDEENCVVKVLRHFLINNKMNKK